MFTKVSEVLILPFKKYRKLKNLTKTLFKTKLGKLNKILNLALP